MPIVTFYDLLFVNFVYWFQPVFVLIENFASDYNFTIIYVAV